MLPKVEYLINFTLYDKLSFRVRTIGGMVYVLELSAEWYTCFLV